MKFGRIIFFLFLFLASCQDNNSTDENSDKKDEYQREFEPEYDSLGYPSYYTHPEIEEIKELKSILDGADKILAYNYNKGQENPANMGDDNQYLYNLETSDLYAGSYNETSLNQEQQLDLISIITDTNTYSGNWSGLAGVCYIPHVGFGFFKEDSLISQVSVCFMCSGIRTNPFYKSDGLSGKGYIDFEAFVKGIGLEVVPR